MKTMPSLLIVDRQQFGYLTDTYQYCKYLKDSLNVTLICWDYGLQRIEATGVEIVYVSRRGNKIVRLARFLLRAATLIRSGRFHVVFVSYFPGVSLLRLAQPKVTMILDIRTHSVDHRWLTRFLFDLRLYCESQVFERITIVSDSARAFLRLPESKCHILPLGGEVCVSPRRSFDAMHLLYVGTFVHRNMEMTVEGFDRFYREMNGTVNVSYEIIGDGFPEDVRRLHSAVEQCSCKEAITLRPWRPHAELAPFFEQNNIGVTFVPRTAYYDVQPSTKTFEYLLAGIPVIATDTLENRRTVNATNGILVDDTAEGFYYGLKTMYQKLHSYDSDLIRQTCAAHEWKNIVTQNLTTLLLSIIDDKHQNDG